MPTAKRTDALRPRKKPIQGRSRDTVATILAAAAQVFTKRGYAATSTNHIAQRAGVSIGSLYEYFPNKDAVLVALMEQHLLEGEEILARVALDTPQGTPHVREIIRGFVHAMVELHAKDRALHRLLFEEAPLPKHMRRQLADIENRIAARVEDYLRRNPKVTQRDPALAAIVLVHTIEGLTHKWVVHDQRTADMNVYLEEIVTLIAAYLGAS